MNTYDIRLSACVTCFVSPRLPKAQFASSARGCCEEGSVQSVVCASVRLCVCAVVSRNIDMTIMDGLGYRREAVKVYIRERT